MSTGPSPKTRALVRERAQGCCERCGQWAHEGQIHHRQPRGMGGSVADHVNQTSNLVLLDPACHAWVERNRAVACAQGWLVRRPLLPVEVPVFTLAGWVWLDDDGEVAA